VAFAIKMVIRLVCAPKLPGPPRSSGMVMQWMAGLPLSGNGRGIAGRRSSFP
jgi:hypothetical protein